MILPSNFNGFFAFGSSVYGTATESSDVDMIVVGDYTPQVDGLVDKRTINRDDLIHFLESHHPTAMEGYSLQFHGDRYGDKHHFSHLVKMDVDLEMLRRSHSSVAINSFVKAKKKLTVEESYDRRSSMKSLFHSIRILDFGCQIAEHGYIRNFESCNSLYNEIVADYDNDDTVVLELIATKYKKMFNEIASKFRILAPINQDNQN